MRLHWTVTLFAVALPGCRDKASSSVDDTGSTDAGYSADGDGDGYSPADGDCADGDPDIHPGQAEVPGNGVDEDCDASDAGPTAELAGASVVWEGERHAMAGWVVQRGGDVDGDGIDDLVVGAPWEAVPGEAVDFPGAVYMVSSDMSSDGLAGAMAVILPDETNAGTGKALVGGGDLNGDGFDDVVVGLFQSEIPSDTQGGRVLVYLGPMSGVLAEDRADAEIWTTRDKAQFGYGLSLMDGGDLLAVGAPAAGGDSPGEAYLWQSVPIGLTDESSASTTIIGTEPDAEMGIHLDGQVDLTADGLVDLVISESEAGGVGVLHVVVAPFEPLIDLTTDSTQLWGARTESDAGRLTLPHPDANGDGHPDLLVSAPLDPEVDTRGGKVWILHGPLTEGGLLDDMAGAAILPEGGYEWLGRSLASPRDLDGDGLSDLAIGVPRDFYFGADYPGKVYLFPSTLSGTVTGADAIGVLQGELPADYASGGMTGGFDADGDGLGDLAVGAPMVNGTGTASGRVYVVTDFP